MRANVSSGWLMVLCLLVLLGVAPMTSAQVAGEIEDLSDAHSRYTPTGPAPEGGYEPYVGAVDTRSVVVIGGVPAYMWRHGCGPTAAGMVLGYWDGQGFGCLVPGDASTQTPDVDAMIADDRGNPNCAAPDGDHYQDYSCPLDSASANPTPLPDLSEPPAGDEHASNCVGDFMRTSWSAAGMYYGWSWFSDVANSFGSYVGWANTEYGAHYSVTTSDETFGAFTWNDLQTEINAGRPVVFLVDSDGDGGTDHFVAVIGWRDDFGINEYGCLDTWGFGTRWEEFRGVNPGDAWGIHGATYFDIATANNPPVADAGPDQTVECAGLTTTVSLDGTASSDPDGDAITYEWSAPGVVILPPDSPTPTGLFEIGTTTVTLTVSDCDFESTDTVDITVVDTTPPDITCPAGVTVECSALGGTPRDDPQLAGFFAGVSADDICCDSPVTITDDAPDLFPLGGTAVTFTATDCNGNENTCEATVNVTDTTPPEITVELNRYVLWPPNHKMSDIVATVTVEDICCPLGFELVSVTSNEDDEGLGDGDMPNDIQGADIGTPDVEFQLRAERSGLGFGRIYTIIYATWDCAGNEANAEVEVRVPHNQHNRFVLPGEGFTIDAEDLLSGASEFSLIIPSDASFDPSGVDVGLAYVGNHIGAIAPISHAFVLANDDEVYDLELKYDALLTLELRDRSASTETGYPVGMHFQHADGTDYRVDDIFTLTASTTGIPEVLDGEVTLFRAVPNPLRESTRLAYAVTGATGTHVSVTVYNVAGQRIRELLDAEQDPGVYQIAWDGRSDAGERVASGVYFMSTVIGVQETRTRVAVVR